MHQSIAAKVDMKAGARLVLMSGGRILDVTDSGPLLQQVDRGDWVAVKALKLNFHVGQTMLIALLYIPIMVTDFKCFNIDPGEVTYVFQQVGAGQAAVSLLRAWTTDAYHHSRPKDLMAAEAILSLTWNRARERAVTLPSRLQSLLGCC